MGLFANIGNWINDTWEDVTGVTAANTSADALTAANTAATEATTTAGQDAIDALRENTQLGIDAQQQQFAALQEMMAPYMTAGTNALDQQQALSGALGPEAQQRAISGIQNSAGFQTSLKQGETSILQNAAATGGVRGGNTQGALAQYSPALLNQAINQRYGQLGGLSGMGQGSAMGVGGAGMGMGSNIAGMYQGLGGALGNVYQGMGAAEAGGIMNQGNIDAQTALSEYSLPANFIGDAFGGIMEIAKMAAMGA